MKNYLVNTLVSVANVEVSFSRGELRLYRSGKLNLLDIKILSKFRTELNELLKDKTFCRLMVSGLAFIMFFSNSSAMAATSDVGEKMQGIGSKLLHIVYGAMKWVCLIKAGLDVGREIGKGGDNGGYIVKIVLKYLMAYGILLLLPQFFDWVEDACLTGQI